MRRRGFTLVELMITVIVVAVLTIIAATSYTRASRRSRMSSEVTTVFASLKTKLETRKLETGSYVNGLSAAPSNDQTDFWPAAAPDSTADDWSVGLPPTHYWAEIGFSPSLRSLYCRYLAFLGNAGSQGGSAWPGGASRAAMLFGQPTQPVEPWYYLVAQCNLQDQGLVPEDSSKWQEWSSRFDNSRVWLLE